MSLWHVTVATDGRLPMIPDEAAARRVVHALVRLAGDKMALFSAADEHVHVVALASDEEIGWLGRALTLGLRAVTRTPVAPARRRRVESRAHAESLLRYLLTQVGHHGLPIIPALWSGSCFQDLVGARLLAGLQLRVSEALPRFRLRQAVEIVGLAPVPVEPAENAAVRTAGATRVIAAAAAAVAAAPELTSNEPFVAEARRAAVQVGLAAGIAPVELAWALKASDRTLQRLRADTRLCPALCRAIRVRLSLEGRITR